MRDRLIELCREAHTKYLDEEPPVGDFGAYLADYLLDNGGLFPPCKVGDTVYMISPGGKIHENLVIGISVHGGESPRFGFLCPHALTFREDHIGETVFLTREEAEQALKGECNAEIH